MSEWQEYYLEELGTLARGKSKHRPRWAPHLFGGDYPFIQTGQITAAQKYITTVEQTYSKEGLLQSKLWDEGTLCITIAANIAEIAILSFPACFPDSVLGFQVDKNKADLDFVFYTLTQFKYRLKSLAIGSVQDNINLGTFKNIQFPFPPLKEQKEIGRTLSLLDKKISLLRQQNQTLEELAQTLFKRWFVEFEFPCLPSGYRPQGQVNLEEMAKVCTFSRVGGVPAPDGQSWFVYVLLCEDGSFYKGMTNDLYRRFYEHCTGDGAKHTKTHKPVKVIHWEQFDTQDEARAREEELKTGFGRTWLQREYDKLQKYGHTTSDGLPAHQTKLVPAGKMVESELGEFPEGWRVGNLGEFSSLKSGYAFKSNDFVDDNSVKAIKIKDLKGNGVVDISNASSIDSQVTNIDRVKYFKLKEGDIVLAMSGNTTGKIGIIPPHKNGLYLNQRVGKFFLKNETYRSFVYNFLMSGNYEERILSMGYGSAQPNINPKQIEEIETLIPNEIVLADFTKISDPIYIKTLVNCDEIQTLTQLRDTLLPKLMSGEVRVKSV